MGSIYLELGQCGIQIGQQLNPRLANSYYSTRNRHPYRQHTIMVDTEPKVLKPYIQKPPRWLDPLNMKYFQYGRGNNWSYGYLHQFPKKEFHQNVLANFKQFSHVGSGMPVLEKYIHENKNISEYVLQRIRKELETVDCALCINVIASLGGGTGSGLGTKLIEKISQQFYIDVFSHLVLPNKSGETPLQVYNCTLSLASIQEHSTAIFTYENDKMTALLEKNQNFSGNLSEINKHISGIMSRLFKTNDLPSYNRFYNEIVSQCVLSSQCKYLSLFGGQSATSWDQVFGSMNQGLKTYLHDDYQEWFGKESLEKRKLLHGQLLLIGNSNPEFETKYAKKLKQILNPLLEDSLNVDKINAKGTHLSSLITEKQKGKETQKLESLLVTNHSNILKYLGYLCSSSSQKYKAQAYLWHYKFADIESAIESMRSTYDSYYYFTN